MKLSKRGEYALRALIDLGIAQELGRPILQVRELAKKEKLPVKFLEQIFAQLKVGGYVQSTRGKFGGYSLAKPMTQIKFGSIIRLIDGPLAPLPCVSRTAYAKCTCPDEAHCGLRLLMLDVRNAIARILDRNTLAQIVEITLRKLRRDKVTPLFLPLSAQIWSPLPSLEERNAEPAQKITRLKKWETFSPSVASEDKAHVKKARRSGRREASLRRSGQPGI
jgi:Rrf2 family protein